VCGLRIDTRNYKQHFSNIVNVPAWEIAGEYPGEQLIADGWSMTDCVLIWQDLR
jgi:hypothetical protein